MIKYMYNYVSWTTYETFAILNTFPASVSYKDMSPLLGREENKLKYICI